MVLLNKLVLNGIGKWENEKSFQFEKGINILSLKKEEGKTTIFNSLKYLIFNIKPDFFENTQNKYNSFVEAEFSINGEILTIKRNTYGNIITSDEFLLENIEKYFKNIFIFLNLNNVFSFKSEEFKIKEIENTFLNLTPDYTSNKYIKEFYEKTKIQYSDNVLEGVDTILEKKNLQYKSIKNVFDKSEEYKLNILENEEKIISLENELSEYNENNINIEDNYQILKKEVQHRKNILKVANIKNNPINSSLNLFLKEYENLNTNKMNQITNDIKNIHIIFNYIKDYNINNINKYFEHKDELIIYLNKLIRLDKEDYNKKAKDIILDSNSKILVDLIQDLENDFEVVLKIFYIMDSVKNFSIIEKLFLNDYNDLYLAATSNLLSLENSIKYLEFVTSYNIILNEEYKLQEKQTEFKYDTEITEQEYNLLIHHLSDNLTKLEDLEKKYFWKKETIVSIDLYKKEIIDFNKNIEKLRIDYSETYDVVKDFETSVELNKRKEIYESELKNNSKIKEIKTDIDNKIKNHKIEFEEEKKNFIENNNFIDFISQKMSEILEENIVFSINEEEVYYINNNPLIISSQKIKNTFIIAILLLKNNILKIIQKNTIIIIDELDEDFINLFDNIKNDINSSIILKNI